MEQDVQKIISEQINKTPKALRDIIIAPDYIERLKEISKGNDLTDEQSGKVYLSTTLVLLGLEPVTDFIDHLIADAKLDEIKAVTIAEDTDDEIFIDVEEELAIINSYLKPQKKIELKSELPATSQTQEIGSPISIPNKNNILAGIETPETINENSISVSTLNSNNNVKQSFNLNSSGKIDLSMQKNRENRPEINDLILNQQDKTEIKSPNLIEKKPEINIMQAKLQGNSLMKKQEVAIEEKTKLPRKNDPYREEF